MLILSPLCSWGQLWDDFSDGNFTENPSWLGDVSQFKVNNQHHLQLNGASAGESLLYTPINLDWHDTIRWEFWVHLGFSPTAGNNCRVALFAPSPDQFDSASLWLDFGGAGDKQLVLRLFNRDSIGRVMLGSSSNNLRVRVEMKPEKEGCWWTSIWVDSICASDGMDNYRFVGTVRHDTLGWDASISQGYFAIDCKYTQSRSTAFSFDDILARASSQLHDDPDVPLPEGDDIFFAPLERLFSPDGDGYQDVLIIAFNGVPEETKARVCIYDLSGRKIRDLMRGNPIDMSGSMTWDGKDDKDRLCPRGNYLIHVDLYGQQGFRKSMRRTCTIVY